MLADLVMSDHVPEATHLAPWHFGVSGGDVVRNVSCRFADHYQVELDGLDGAWVRSKRLERHSFNAGADSSYRVQDVLKPLRYKSTRHATPRSEPARAPRGAASQPSRDPPVDRATLTVDPAIEKARSSRSGDRTPRRDRRRCRDEPHAAPRSRRGSGTPRLARGALR
jgi:hypothetical protein